MTNLPNDGPSDTEFTCPLVTANATAVASAASPANTRPSSSWYEYMQQFASPTTHRTTRLRGLGTNNKGKAVHQSRDWTRDASESEREGKLGSLLSITDIHVGFIFYTELAYRLLASLPRSRLATVQRRIVPLLQFDLVGVSFMPPHSFQATFSLVVSTTRIVFANIHVAPCNRTPQLCAGLQAMECACQRSNPMAQSLSRPWLEVAVPTDQPCASAK